MSLSSPLLIRRPGRPNESSYSSSRAPSSFKPHPVFSPTATLPLTRPLSPLLSTTPSTQCTKFLFVVESPPVLSRLASHLEWSDILAFLNTCRDSRNIFRYSLLRDILLSRLVPGYADALRLRDLTNYHHVPVSIQDLDLLLISLKLPLHRYPTHVLRVLTALYPTLEDDYITTKMVALSLAHSRFVLLLQALVHSSSSPIPPEKEFTSRISRRPSSHHVLITKNTPQLNFPVPLSYLKQQQNHSTAQLILPDPPVLSKRSKRHSLPSRSKSLDPSYSHPFGHTRAVLPPADSISTMISINNTYGEPHETAKVARRRSIFKKSTVTPPPPEEPRALRVYSRTWRKSTWNSGHNFTPGHQSTGLDDLASIYGSDDFVLHRPPKRQFVPSINVSSDSSVSSSPVTSSSPLPRTGFESSSSSSSGGRSSPPPPTPPPTIFAPKCRSLSTLPMNIRTSSPHDLRLATSRVRAPILRVFVPCTKMELDSESVLKCEKYLVEAGLWEHLSTGDVVCNLGYVPPTTSDDITGEDSRDSSPTRFGPSRFSVGSSANNSKNWRKWLLFNGECLIPYTALDVLPIDNPISLPSPYYYTHIIPTGNVSGYGSSGFSGTAVPGGASNFRFWIGKFPPLTMEEGVPHMAMVNVTGRVRSARAPSGWIDARKWVWTARIGRYKPKFDLPFGSSDTSLYCKQSHTVSQPQVEVGEAWYGEWVLEGEGTSEGHQELLNILGGGNVPGGPREWELVRERSGNGRIWLRMVT